MRIYRVEHKLSGLGPYMHKWPYAQDLHADHAGDPKRPCPEDDITLRMNYSHCYGFDSAEALKAWFEGWVRLDVPGNSSHIHATMAGEKHRIYG